MLWLAWINDNDELQHDVMPTPLPEASLLRSVLLPPLSR
jgi:hypothetical protein